MSLFFYCHTEHERGFVFRRPSTRQLRQKVHLFSFVFCQRQRSFTKRFHHKSTKTRLVNARSRSVHNDMFFLKLSVVNCHVLLCHRACMHTFIHSYMHTCMHTYIPPKPMSSFLRRLTDSVHTEDNRCLCASCLRVAKHDILESTNGIDHSGDSPHNRTEKGNPHRATRDSQ